MHCSCLVLVLCAFGALAYRLDHDFEDFRDWQYDPVGPEHKPSGADDDDKNAKCKKNILVLLDTSPSVKMDNFNNKVKPFLRKFIQDSRLNVSKSGTHIAFVGFGDDTKELVLFNQGSTSYTRSSLEKNIAGWKWENMSKGGTRTDLALKKAIEIFKNRDTELNERSKYDDVILLITDGRPKGYMPNGYTIVTDETVRARAVKKARKLMSNNVVIVGLWVADVKNDDDIAILKDMSSPGRVFSATFENVDTIIKSIVNGTCEPTPAHGCICPATGSLGNFTLESGSSTRKVTWEIPEPECMHPPKKLTLTATYPENDKSGDSFSIGRHKIEYTYTVNGETLIDTCDVIFEVEGDLCGEEGFDPSTQKCCCGTTHNAIPGHECCGQYYFSPEVKQCCPNSIVWDKELSCPRQKSLIQ